MSYLHGLYGATSKRPKTAQKKKRQSPKVQEDDFGFFESPDDADNSDFVEE